MKKAILLGAALATSPLVAHATTLSLNAFSAFYVPPTTQSDSDDITETENGTPVSGTVDAIAPIPEGLGSSFSQASGDTAIGRLEVSTFSEKAPGDVSRVHFSTAQARLEDTFVVEGDGNVKMVFDLSGRLNAVSDRDDILDTFFLSANFRVEQNGVFSVFTALQTSALDDALFGLEQADIDRVFEVNLPVFDGDILKLSGGLFARAGDLVGDAPVLSISPEFFSVEAYLSGQYTFVAEGGARLIFGDDTVAPVPLPAGLPLLAAGLAMFGLARRRRV